MPLHCPVLSQCLAGNPKGLLLALSSNADQLRPQQCLLCMCKGQHVEVCAVSVRSPTDNMLVAMGRWMDDAIPLVPNRYSSALPSTGAKPALQHTPLGSPAGAGAFPMLTCVQECRNDAHMPWSHADMRGAAVKGTGVQGCMTGDLHCSLAGAGPPVFRSEPREAVLDRYGGHTAICPDSMRAYQAFRNARIVLGAAAALAASALASTAALVASGGAADSTLLPWWVHAAGRSVARHALCHLRHKNAA